MAAGIWKQVLIFLLFPAIPEVGFQSTCVNSSAFPSGSRAKIAGLPERLRVYWMPAEFPHKQMNVPPPLSHCLHNLSL